MPASPVTSSVALLCTLSRTLISCLYFKAQNSTQYSSQCCTNTKYSNRISSFDWLVMHCLMHPEMQFVAWLPGHTAGSWCQSALPDPFLFPSIELLSHHSSPSLCLHLLFSIPGAEPGIFLHWTMLVHHLWLSQTPVYPDPSENPYLQRINSASHQQTC